MIKWEYYEKRRNVSLVAFIRGRDIRSYEELTKELERQGIEPLDLGIFQSAYAIAFPPIPEVQPKPKKAPARKPRKPAAKKTTPAPPVKAPSKNKTTTRRRSTRKK